MMLNILRSLMILLLLSLAGCASWLDSYEKPQVSITSFSLDPASQSVSPTFLIGLRVVNPNRSALPINGMSYSLEVEQQRILSGAEPNLPEVPAYGTTEFTVRASPDLLGSARLISQLLSGQRDSLHYRFSAKFDVGRLLPFITLEEEGNFGFGKNAEEPAY